MQQLPIITKIADIDVTTVSGQPLFRMYGQAIRILEREPDGKQFSNFFAEPSLSEIEQVVYWRTRLSGPVRVWADLNEAQRLAATQGISTVCQRIENVCDMLTNIQGANSPSVTALRAMLVTPSLETSLCLVGDQLVLTQWGCRPFGRAPADFDLKVQGKQAALPVRAPVVPAIEEPVPAAEAPPVKVEPPAPTPAIEPTPTVEPSAPEVVAEKAVEPEVKALDPVVPPAPPPTEPEPEKEPLPPRKPLYWRWLVLLLLLLLLLLGLWLKKWTYIAAYDTDVEDRYRSDIATLWQNIDEKSKTCKRPPSAPAGSIPKPAPATPPKTLDRDSMVRKDLNVFNGGWQMITDLLSSATREKIRIEMSFDDKGQGTAAVREAGGDVCSGSASVSITSPNSFSVAMAKQTCQISHRSYSADNAQCVIRPDNKTADCVLQCQEGPCNAVFERR